MKNMTMGVFSDRSSAENAIEELKSLGYANEDISVIMKDESDREKVTENTGVQSDAAEDTTKGAITGAGVGALAGLLVGVGAVAFPPIAGIALAGPIASALGVSTAAASTIAGAGVGAGVGGLVGLLTSLGLSEEEARTYETRIQNKGILIAVDARDENANEVESVFVENGADEIRTRVGSDDRM